MIEMVENKPKNKRPYLKLGNRDNPDWYSSEVARCAKLVSACQEGKIDEVRRLLLIGVPPCTDMEGNSPIDLAATPEIAQLLIEAGADVDAVAADGAQPIHAAAFRGKLEVVKFLVKNGADVNAKGPGDTTPLHLASTMSDAELKGADYEELVRFLIEKGADVNAKNAMGYPPLDFAKNKAVIGLLEGAGARKKEVMP